MVLVCLVCPFSHRLVTQLTRSCPPGSDPRPTSTVRKRGAKHATDRVLQVEILGGKHNHSELAFIPRITLIPSCNPLPPLLPVYYNCE